MNESAKMNGIPSLRTLLPIGGLLFLLFPFKGGVAHAVLYKDTPIYHQAFVKATRSDEKGGLGLHEDKAKKFAMSVASHSRDKDVLQLFLSVFSHFDLENPSEFDAAKKLAEDLSKRPDNYCAQFLEAFDFAHNPVSFLDAGDAAEFARAAAALPVERLEAYRAAYNFSRGSPYYMASAYAVLFANSAGNRPGMLDRYRFAFSNILENSSAGFNASLSLAEDLANISKDDYHSFLTAYYKARQAKQSQEEALTAARKVMEASKPMDQPVPSSLLTVRLHTTSAPTTAPMLEARSAESSTASPGPAGDGKKASAEVPVSVREDAANFRKSL